MDKLEGKGKSKEEQIKILEEILKKNTILWEILKRLEDYSKTNSSFKNYYLSAGCINQTVFNYYHDYPLNYGIKDYDIVYYEEDTSYEAEDKIIKDIEKLLKDLQIEMDIKNQKRVPIWYKEKYKEERNEYTSVEDAISRWTSTITCMGVRLEKEQLIVCAPYGLEDLFSLIIRPVKKETKKELYEEKSKNWKEKWPKLQIIDWE